MNNTPPEPKPLAVETVTSTGSGAEGRAETLGINWSAMVAKTASHTQKSQ